MVRRRGPRLTLAEKTELWRRWRHGESLNAIGRALGRIAHVVRYEVARTGGLPPPVRQRSPLALTLGEREAISRGLASGTSVRQISRQLRRAPSTVSREVRRHGGRRWYRYLTPGRPKSRNIAVLSPHSPVIGPHAPPDRAVVIIGFTDRGSAGSHALSIRRCGVVRGEHSADHVLVDLDVEG